MHRNPLHSYTLAVKSQEKLRKQFLSPLQQNEILRNELTHGDKGPVWEVHSLPLSHQGNPFSALGSISNPEFICTNYEHFKVKGKLTEVKGEVDKCVTIIEYFLNKQERKNILLEDLNDTWRRQRQPTSVFLPGESHGQRSLVGCSP